ncbi:MAG: hypothetical protein M1838_000070 [Thelocarpon superellum]|nr:MAG: hypothetical protein M1838_000070 [Thelocarpon superellum]
MCCNTRIPSNQYTSLRTFSRSQYFQDQRYLKGRFMFLRHRASLQRQRAAEGQSNLAYRNSLKKHMQTAHTRPFRCIFAPYGCDGTFGSRNEWKRHINSQHLCLSFWRCNLGTCTSDPERPNLFNRKDLFTQHLRRMHCPVKKGTKGPELTQWNATLDAVRHRCFVVRRDPPPRSGCGFCNKVFEHDGGWEECLEHIGRHFENKAEAEALSAAGGGGCSSPTPSTSSTSMEAGLEAREDPILRAWLIDEGLIGWNEAGTKMVVLVKGCEDALALGNDANEGESRSHPQDEDDEDADADAEGEEAT